MCIPCVIDTPYAPSQDDQSHEQLSSPPRRPMCHQRSARKLLHHATAFGNDVIGSLGCFTMFSPISESRSQFDHTTPPMFHDCMSDLLFVIWPIIVGCHYSRGGLKKGKGIVKPWECWEGQNKHRERLDTSSQRYS